MLPTTTPLGFLNFLILQWFCIRLIYWWDHDAAAEAAPRGRWWSRHAPRGVPMHFRVGAAWPMTGWWGIRYRAIRASHVLDALNFVLLQWFGVRLERVAGQRWTLLRWIWPLTGWWSSVAWISCQPVVIDDGIARS